MSNAVAVCRYAHHQAPSRPALQVHEFSALALCTSGSAIMEQQGRWAVREGDVMLVPAGAAHRSLSSQRAVMTGVQLTPSVLLARAQGHLLAPFERVRRGAAAVVSIPGPRQQFLRQLIQELDDELSLRPLADVRTRDSLLTLIVHEVSRAAELLPAPVLQADVVGDALRFIEQRCLGPLTLQEVAAAVRRSPAYLTTLLKRSTGKSAVQWIIAGRMAEARRRLLHSDELVEVIAERVGYADPTHFVRLFRRAHGQTPSAFRAAGRAAREQSQARLAIVSS